MSTDFGRLAPRERRALLYGSAYRIAGTPVVVALALVNTSIVVRQTGAEVYGLVALITTVTLLFPFADLGVGATVLSASARLSVPGEKANAVNVIRRGYRVLFGVAAGLIAVALVVLALDGWTALVGLSSGPADRWAITVAAIIFALTIPAGLGVRILIGIDENPKATLVQMSCPAFALMLTLLFWWWDVDGIWYAVAQLGGLLIGLTLGTVIALRDSGLRWSAFAPVSGAASTARLLEGSLWLFLVALGAPFGVQTGRLLLAHLSTAEELSRYALMAQIYAVCWQVISTAAMAYWPVFVKRRAAPEQTVRMWWRVTAALTAAAALACLLMAVAGPWAARVLSGGRIDVSVALALAFGALLIVQSAYMPAKVLLTNPKEARWQAFWMLAMAALSVAGGWLVAGRFGAVAVVYAAALSVLLALVLPALLGVPRLVRRRRPSVPD